MIAEWLVEDFIITRLRSRLATTALGVKTIDRIGMYQVDPETAKDFVKHCPAILLGFTGDTVVRDQSALGLVQTIDYTLEVGIFTAGLFERRETSDRAHAIAGAVKDALRGLTYTPNDGNTEQASWLRYTGREVATIGTIMLQTQRYTLRVQDRSASWDNDPTNP